MGSGWNRGDPARKPESKVAKPGIRRGFLAALIVVIGGVLVALFFFGNGEKDDVKANEEKPKRIKEVRPAVVTNKVATEEKKERPVEMVMVNGVPTPRIQDGIVKYPPWGVGKNEVTGGVYRVKSLAERCFDTLADVEIAGLLSLEPGEALVGDDEEMQYRNFNKQFLKSLETPIIITKDDTPEMVALKQAVKDTRMDLKIRLDHGEDISKIMIATRKELRELGAYREELQQELRKLHAKPEMTAEDMKDFVTAANQMLESRGAKQIEMPEITYERLKLRQEIFKLKQNKENNQ